MAQLAFIFSKPIDKNSPGFTVVSKDFLWHWFRLNRMVISSNFSEHVIWIIYKNCAYSCYLTPCKNVYLIILNVANRTTNIDSVQIPSDIVVSLQHCMLGLHVSITYLSGVWLVAALRAVSSHDRQHQHSGKHIPISNSSILGLSCEQFSCVLH